jgi:uncharacterized membrane protein YhaH (DUF805 family)
MAEQVRVVFASEVLPGFAVDAVRGQLGRVFKLDASRLDAMFAGGRTVLKRSVSQEEGQRYVDKLLSLGAKAFLEPASAPGAPPPAPPVRLDAPTPAWPTIVAEPLAVEAPRAAPALPPVTASAPAKAPSGLPPTGPSPLDAGGLKLVDIETTDAEQVDCPTCGERQPKRVLCRSCATDIARGIAAKQEALEDARLARQEEVRGRRGDRPSMSTGSAAPSLFGFGFSGRLARWPYAAAGLLSWAVLVLLFVGFARSPGWFTLVLLTLGLLAVIVWSVRVTVLRLHDMELSAWWALLLFVPYVGGLGSILLMVWPGTHGDNDYGEPARRGNWLLAMVSLSLLCITLGVAWRTAVLALRGDLPIFAGLHAAQGDEDADVPGRFSVPDEVASGLPPGEATDEFRQNYAPASTHKAFAISPAGAWGWKAEAVSIEQAARDALQACEGRREPYTPPCVLVNVDGYTGPPSR